MTLSFDIMTSSPHQLHSKVIHLKKELGNKVETGSGALMIHFHLITAKDWHFDALVALGAKRGRKANRMRGYDMSGRLG